MEIYMLGIGGVSMSALAVMLTEAGNEVCGSDECDGRGVEILRGRGIAVDLPKDSDEQFAQICDFVKENGVLFCAKKSEFLKKHRPCLKNIENTKNTQKMQKNTEKTEKNCKKSQKKCQKENFKMDGDCLFCGEELEFALQKCQQYFKSLFECDFVVCSSAIKHDDVRMILAKVWGKKILSRGQMLGQISDEYEKVVAVAGSHGKTTTTAMIYNILRVAGKNPTLHLGGYQISDGKNFHLGGKEFFVTEACEYCDNFLFLHPYLSVVTNVEKEHMDFFRTFENEKKSFEKFKANSKIVIDSFCGIEAKNIRHDKNGYLIFSLFENGKKLMNLHMHLCEEINTANCIYAYLAAKKLGIADCQIKMGLENFLGVGTRFERKNSPFFDFVICDYAHHPTEIDKAISSAKKIFKGKTIVTIFQPHTYSRTKTLLPQFLKVFGGLEHPLFFKTYSAREKECEGLSGKDLTEILQKTNKNAKYFENFCDLKAFLMNFSKRNTVLLFLGAGDLPQILEREKFVRDNLCHNLI